MLPANPKQNCFYQFKNPEDAILGNRSRDEMGAGVQGLPDDALIWLRKGKGDSWRRSFQQCDTYYAYKKCTKAGTGCGGCIPMVKRSYGLHL